MASLGYARVSTSHQSLDQQHDALNAAGVERIFDDVMSGTRDDRPGLAALLDYAREGDTVTVVALDRLGRSLSGIIGTVEQLKKRGIAVRSLREGWDFRGPQGELLVAIFAALATYEVELIRERATAAREAAASRGRQVGRPRALDSSQLDQARTLRKGGHTMREIAKTIGVSEATQYRAMRDEPDSGDAENLTP